MAVEAPIIDINTEFVTPSSVELSRKDRRLLEKEEKKLHRANRPSKRYGIDAGVAYGAGPIGGRAKLGMHAEKKNPETDKRKYDIFLGVGPKVVGTWIPTVATHGKSGMDKTYSFGGFGWSKHPVIGEQKRANLAVAQAAVGEVSTVGLEVPLGVIAPFAALIGAEEIASAIHSLGNHMWITRVQLSIHLESKKLGIVKEKIDQITSHIPRLRIKERFNLRKQNHTGPTIKEEATEIFLDINRKIPEHA